MLAFLEQGGADVAVVQYIDRFGRKPREMLRRIWQLEEAGITVESTDEDVREEILLLVRAGIAGYEVRRIAERVSSNIWNKVASGVKFGIPPYGYKGIRGEPDKDGRVRVIRF
jgi:DNA invertase Pin-like site-specific DNA recombinase